MNEETKPESLDEIAPIHIISLGAGVQSSTMALMAAHGEITPMPKCAIFADTQDEPQSVYKWLDWLEKQLPFPVHRVTSGSLSKTVTRIKVSKGGNLYTDSGLPVHILKPDNGKGLGQRQCTKEFKVYPIRKFLRQFKDTGVIQWIGISLDESHRMKPAWDKWCKNRWPLIDLRMKRHDCLLWMQTHGYPKPPRSACIYCPYHSDTEWRRLRSDEKQEFERAVEFERELQRTFAQLTFIKGHIPFLHPSRVPLDQVDFSTDEDHGQQVMFGNECEGLCGV
jgi:hypothetical protein